jgi:hypothetical protein
LARRPENADILVVNLTVPIKIAGIEGSGNLADGPNEQIEIILINLPISV